MPAAAVAIAEPSLAASAGFDEIENLLGELARTSVRVRRPAPGGVAQLEAEHASLLLQTMTEKSIGEMEQLIGAVAEACDVLRGESERVRQDVAAFFRSSRSALDSLKPAAGSVRMLHVTSR